MDKGKLIKALICICAVVLLFCGCQGAQKSYYELESAGTSEVGTETDSQNNGDSSALAPEKVTDYNYSYTNHDDFSAWEFFDGYTNAIGAAINNGDFSMVQPYLLRGSALYNTQKARVEKQFNAGKKEYVLEYQVDGVQWESKTKGSLYVYEKVDTVESNGKNKVEEVRYKYTIVFQDGRYYLSDRLKPDAEEDY